MDVSPGLDIGSISQKQEAVQRKPKDRLQRVQKWIGDRKNALGAYVDMQKFKLLHPIPSAGYFITGPDERYFYTVFQRELLNQRLDALRHMQGDHVTPEQTHMTHSIQKLDQRAGAIMGVHRDKIKDTSHIKEQFRADATRLAIAYEQNRLHSSEDNKHAIENVLHGIVPFETTFMETLQPE